MKKPILRILLGVVGVIGVFFGVRQMISGFHEISGTTIPQKIGESVTLSSHGCALRVPQGWEKKDGDNGGTVFSAPKSSGYAVNLLIMSEAFAGSLRNYADVSVRALKDMVPDAEVKTDVPFARNSGAPGLKIGLRRRIKELDLIQGFYVFDGKPGHKIAITTSAPAKQSAEIEPLLEDCLKSLTVPP